MRLSASMSFNYTGLSLRISVCEFIWTCSLNHQVVKQEYRWLSVTEHEQDMELFHKNGFTFVIGTLLFIINTSEGMNHAKIEVCQMSNVVPASKPWIVFMERRVWLCGQTSSNTIGPYNFLRCLSCDGYRKSTCLYKLYFNCFIIKKGENVLHTRSPYMQGINIKLYVHNSFSLNSTFTLLRLSSYNKNVVNHLDISINGTSQRHTEDRLPWIIVTKHTSAKLSLRGDSVQCFVDFEFGITQRLYYKRYPILSKDLIYYGYSQIQRIHIAVEIIARIRIGIYNCRHCKLIAYDGPHEIFPVILRKTIGLRDISFCTSTHHGVVLVINETLFNLAHFRYDVMLVIHSSFTLGPPAHVLFDNNTHCNNNSNTTISQSCVYEFAALDNVNIRLTLEVLEISGKFQGTKFGAGVVVYNVMDGRQVKVAEWYASLQHFIVGEIPITSTENKMYLVVFRYSPFSNIYMKAMLTTEYCTGLFWGLSRSSITLMDDVTAGWDKSDSNTTDRRCIRVHMMSLFHEKGMFPNINIRMKSNLMLMVQLQRISLIRLKQRCHHAISRYQDVTLVSHTQINRIWQYSYVGVVNDVNLLRCSRNNIITVEVTVVQCEMPCNNILKHKLQQNVGKICNFCKYMYVGRNGQTMRYVTLKRKGLLDLEVFAPNYGFVELVFSLDLMSHSKRLLIGIDRNQIIQLSSQTAVGMAFDSRHILGIPKNAISDFYNDMKITAGNGVGMNMYFDGRLHQVMMYNYYFSWYSAAVKCSARGGHIIVIHSQDQYRFIQEVIKTTVVGALLIGGKQQVRAQLFLAENMSEMSTAPIIDTFQYTVIFDIMGAVVMQVTHVKSISNSKGRSCLTIWPKSIIYRFAIVDTMFAYLTFTKF